MAPRLFACFGRGGSGSKGASPEGKATTTEDQTVLEEQRRGGPVLLELYTSQGCGTSPEAELLLSRLGRGDMGEELPVAVLAFHVDYWDYRGWRDPFASSAWTVRQKAYVEALSLDTLYTPQLVVQGRNQCLGTDQEAILTAVQAAPRFPSPTMQATFQKPSPETLEVSLTGALRTKVDSGGADVMVALYESGSVTDCERGENKGRVLANDYVVRCMEKMCTIKDVSAKKNISGNVKFPLWDSFNPAKCGVLLFVQNSALHIFGVKQIQIPDTI